MFVKLQHLDTNRVPVFPSANAVAAAATGINGGVSLSLSLSVPAPLPHHRTERKLEQPQPMRKLKNPRRKPSGFDKRGVLGRPESDLDGSLGSPFGEEVKVVKNRDVKGRVWSRKENLATEELRSRCPPKFVSRNDAVKKAHTKCSTKCVNGDDAVKKAHTKCSTKCVTEDEVVKKAHAKSSTKWARYGGCIPAILEALEQVHDLDAAFQPWEGRLSNKEMTVILKEQNRWERAMEIFQWFKRNDCYKLNVIHYNIMIRTLGKAHRWGELETLIDEMEHTQITATNSTFGTLIDVYTKGGYNDKAMYWLETMNAKAMEPDEVTMGIVVQMYKKSRQFEKAEEFFKKWSTGSKRTDVPTPTRASLSAHTYNTLIDTYGKSGRLKDAFDTFEGMLREGIVPDTVTFNTLIHMFGSYGRLDEVALLLRKMEELWCPPDTRTYNILVSVHARRDDVVTAAEWFHRMKAAALEPDAVGCRTLLYALAIRRMVREAEELVFEMDEKGLEIDEFTQSSVTRMYVESGLLEKSWSWFARFHASGSMSRECLAANIDAFGESGHVCEAEKAFGLCRNPGVLESNVMIKAYGVGKRHDDACRLFDAMAAPDTCSYNSLIQSLAAAGLPERAAVYLRRMRRMTAAVHDCAQYSAVISSFVKSGRPETAAAVFREMVAADVEPDVVVYGVLINAFIDVGNVDEALRYVDEMRNAGLPTNAVIRNSLIKLYTKIGSLKDAEDAFRTLGVGPPDVYVSNCMIELYGKRSMVEPAEEIFENLRTNGFANEFSYVTMLRMYEKTGRFDRAFETARNMRERGMLTDALTYNVVIGLYASDGRFNEAVAVFKEMTVARVPPNDSTFKSLGLVLTKRGVSKRAVEKLEAMSGEDRGGGVEAWMAVLDSVVGIVNHDCCDEW